MKFDDEKSGLRKNGRPKNQADKKKAIAEERRHQAALERLGTNNPRCTLCAEDDWRCIERHHIAGRKYDSATVLICRNCHRKLSDPQKDHPEQINSPSELLEIVGHFLLVLADFFAELIVKLREFGNALIERTRANVTTAEVPS